MAENEAEIDKLKTQNELHTPVSATKPEVEISVNKVYADGLKEKMNQIMQMKPQESKPGKEDPQPEI